MEEDYEYEEALYYEEPVVVVNPLPNPPVGGRAVLGVAGALGLATLGAAVWSRLEKKTWLVNRIGTTDVRLKLAGAQLLTATIAAGVAARPGQRKGTIIGTALGVVAGQIPLLVDPFMVKRHPIMANIWQYGLPIGGALLGANATS